MPDFLWVWQGGSDANDTLRGATLSADGSAIVGGETFSFGDDYEWAVTKIDADGGYLWTWEISEKPRSVTCLECLVSQDDQLRDEEAYAVGLAENGSVVIAGGDAGDPVIKLNAQGKELSRGQNFSVSAQGMAMTDAEVVLVGNWADDFVVVTLDSGLAARWRWQNGSGMLDEGFAVAVTSTSVVVAGNTQGNWSGYHIGSRDFAVVSLNKGDGSEAWRWQGGTTNTDEFLAACAAADGSVVMAGWTNGVWGANNAGGYDFAATRLDMSGEVVWKYQDGTSQEDVLTAVVIMDDNVWLAGYTSGDWNGASAGGTDAVIIQLNLTDGSEVWRWQNGTAEDDMLYGAASGSADLLVFCGQTSGSWGQQNLGDGDFLTLMMDTASSSPAVSEASSMSTTDLTPSSLPTLAPTPSPTGSSGTDSLGSTTILVIAGVVCAFVVAAMLVVISHKLVARRRGATGRKTRTSVPQDQTQVSHTGDGRGTEGPSGSGVEKYLRRQMTWPTKTEANVLHGQLPSRRRIFLPFASSQRAHSNTFVLERRSSTSSIGNSVAPRTLSRQGSAKASADRIGDADEAPGSAQMMPEVGSLEGPHRSPTYVSNASTSSDSEQGPEVAPAKLGSSSGRAASRSAASLDGNGAADAGLGVAGAILCAAQHLAAHSSVPGVGEAATLVSILVDLVRNSIGHDVAVGWKLKRCRSIVTMLERAADVLGKGGDTLAEADRFLLDDVHDAVADLVELMRTYERKNKLTQLITSSLFKRREEDAEVIVDAAISRLQWGMNVQIGSQVTAVEDKLDEMGNKVNEVLDLQRRAAEMCMRRPEQDPRTEALRSRRRRRREQVEIPEGYLTVTDELLGRGGFGAVYLADYNGRNAAAKVIRIEHSLQDAAEEGFDEQKRRGDDDWTGSRHFDIQRKAFLRELDTMIRLRSPHIVHVYGAMTSDPSRLVLVMELMAGGDLRTFLKNALEPLPESVARGIMRDVCTGMLFLHGKSVVHGDLKSANVLFDATGRVKIGDFGTSRWSAMTSTCLLTSASKAGNSIHISLAWAAPEVLDGGCATRESDMYSFGIVVWEILTRDLPWASARPRNIIARVFRGERPPIPACCPPDMAEVIRSCWAEEPQKRLRAETILTRIKTDGCRQTPNMSDV